MTDFLDTDYVELLRAANTDAGHAQPANTAPPATLPDGLEIVVSAATFPMVRSASTS